MQFPKFEPPPEAQPSQFDFAPKQKSLKQLQSIYLKNRNRKRELQQLTQHNKNSYFASSEQQQKSTQDGNFQTFNLLDENKESFKVVKVQYCRLVCIIHIIYLAVIILEAQNIKILLKLALIILNIVTILASILHYSFNPKQSAPATESQARYPKFLNTRTKYLIFQMVIFIITDALTVVSGIFTECNWCLYAGLPVGAVGIVYVNQIRKLYRVQKNMDASHQLHRYRVSNSASFQVYTEGSNENYNFQ